MVEKQSYYEDKILTVPNVISVIRILLIPVFIYLLMIGYNISAFLVFALSSFSDFLDGFIARRFNQTSKLGQILDPIADRGLLICGVIVLTFFVDSGMGRLPVWICVIVLFRDLLFLVVGGYLLKKYNIIVKVIYVGKAATACFYIGFAMLVIAWPVAIGLGWINVAWLPGFSQDPYFVGIWFVYVAIILGTISSIYYVKGEIEQYWKVKHARR